MINSTLLIWYKVYSLNIPKIATFDHKNFHSPELVLNSIYSSNGSPVEEMITSENNKRENSNREDSKREIQQERNPTRENIIREKSGRRPQETLIIEIDIKPQ